MPEGTFLLQIPNLEALIEALRAEPEIAKPTLQDAINKAQAVLAKNTTRGNVPWRTGNLVQTFQPAFGDLWATWSPTASYARFVEFGTGIFGPNKQRIVPTTKKALFWQGAEHPWASIAGQQANPYMERVMQASQTEINQLFTQALQIITKDIANSSQ